MKNLKTVIAALGVFAMTIGSGFAMDNNPPTEPVKAIFKMEVVEEAPMQTPHSGPFYYKDSSGNCVQLVVNPMPSNCTTAVTSNECWYDIDGLGNFVRLYGGLQLNPDNTCELTIPLFEIPVF